MITVSYETFLRLLAQGSQQQRRRQAAEPRERVLRPDQEMVARPAPPRQLATCPHCDFVVDAQHLHPVTGLCPRCQQEQAWRG